MIAWLPTKANILDCSPGLIFVQIPSFSVSTVHFSNEDNCCQLQGIGKLITEKLLQGIFKVD